MISMAASVIVHFVCIGIFFYWLDLGILGAAISTSIHLFSRLFFIHFLIKTDAKLNETYKKPFTAESFKNLVPQAIFCFKGLFSVALPWWAADLFLLMATYCSKQQLAAMTILRNITLLTYMFPIGIQFTAMTYVGIAIGAGKVTQARYYTKLTFGMAMTWFFVIFVILNALKTPILTAFTSTQGILDSIDQVWFIVNFYILFDVIQGTLMGSIKGLGA